MSVGLMISRNLSEALSFNRLMAVAVSKKAMPLFWQKVMIFSILKHLFFVLTK